MSSAREILQLATAVFAGAGVLLDLYSLYLSLRRNRLGGGSSGVSGVAWFAYLSFCLARQRFLWLVGLTVFHAACHFIIPILHRRMIEPADE